MGAKSGRAVVGRGASCPEKGCEGEGRCSFRLSTPHSPGEAVELCCWRLRGLGTSKNQTSKMGAAICCPGVVRPKAAPSSVSCPPWRVALRVKHKQSTEQSTLSPLTATSLLCRQGAMSHTKGGAAVALPVWPQPRFWAKFRVNASGGLCRTGRAAAEQKAVAMPGSPCPLWNGRNFSAVRRLGESRADCFYT